MREKRIRCLLAAMMATLATISVAAQSSTTNKTESDTRVETTSIPFKVAYETSRTVSAGRMFTSQPGKPGEIIKTYTVNFKDGKPVSKTLVSTRQVDPVDEIILMGKEGFVTSRHQFTRSRVMIMSASAYDPSPQTIPGTRGRCANGMKAGFGVVAVDPRVIPLGTTLYVEGYGLAVAADTGGAIKGNRIDLCYNARSTALRFGRRQVRVHVLHGS